jgi:RNA polymerase sigma factor (sigma-70 family)
MGRHGCRTLLFAGGLMGGGEVVTPPTPRMGADASSASATAVGERTPHLGNLEVAEQVRRAAAGDQRAWGALIDRFGNMVWAVARGHGLNASDAADVSQTTWLRLVEHLDRIQQPERIGAWLATTARRESLRVLRVGRRAFPSGDESVMDGPDVRSPSPDRDVLVDERDLALQQAFSRLPTRCQLILRMLTGDEPMNYRALSAALSMPVGSIGPTRGRCLEHLRRLAVGAGVVQLDEIPS